MKRALIPFIIAVLGACTSPESESKKAADAESSAAASAPSITVYCGRSKTLVALILERFEKATGIDTRVRYGKTVALGAAILEEGDRSPADVFFSQDAGALGVLSSKGRLAKLPAATLERVSPSFKSRAGDWVGISGRARVVAYSKDRIKRNDLPTSIDDLTDVKWRGRVGWPPTNASFQTFITALRSARGEDGAEAWLTKMNANAPRAYPKNTPIIAAIAAKEIDLGLVNHYYLHRFLKEQGDAFPVENHYLPSGDAGSLINAAGVGVLVSSSSQEAAQRLVDFLLSYEAQRYFAEKTYEYPLAKGVNPYPGLPATLDQIKHPKLDLNELRDLEASLALMRKVGVLK